MTLKKQIKDNAEDISLFSTHARILSKILLEDERICSKTYILTYFTDYLLEKIHTVSETIAEDSFKLYD